MASKSFYHWSETADLKFEFLRWSLKEQRKDEELNKKVAMDQKTCDMLADLQIKTKNEIEWKKAREIDILGSVYFNV
uniref:Uncharacterized protein n=1 Tax=Helianthus annuus TaxID=4232 RepID=A0A251VI35_HELAN